MDRLRENPTELLRYVCVFSQRLFRTDCLSMQIGEHGRWRVHDRWSRRKLDQALVLIDHYRGIHDHVSLPIAIGHLALMNALCLALVLRHLLLKFVRRPRSKRLSFRDMRVSCIPSWVGVSVSPGREFLVLY
jgi:hypothetical protein